jgi:hypothetical protein
MTDPRQDERERVARAFMDRHRLLGFEGCLKAIPDSVRALAELLKATEAAVLEEAANMVIQEHRMGDRDGWIDLGVKMRDMAEERRS